MVSMTSGAALYVSGLVDGLREGTELSLESMANGEGLKKLEDLCTFSQYLSNLRN